MQPHGIMFHHFSDDHHPKGQGAITAAELDRIIEYVGRDRIVDAQDWILLSNSRRLREDQLCITFDDALRCQYDIARPVLEEHGIKAFFFAYSSVFEGEMANLEVFRYFRTVAFEDIDQFFERFDQVVRNRYPEEHARHRLQFEETAHLKEYEFYSDNDRWFRYTRDILLGEERYSDCMFMLMKEFEFETESLAQLLWMDNDCLRSLAESGHIVGLHSYSHPMSMESLPEPEQRAEYEMNFRHLKEVLGKPPVSMSHPRNSYNDDTLKLLSSMGIQVGFRANMSGEFSSPLETPRIDHAYLVEQVR